MATITTTDTKLDTTIITISDITLDSDTKSDTNTKLDNIKYTITLDTTSVNKLDTNIPIPTSASITIPTKKPHMLFDCDVIIDGSLTIKHDTNYKIADNDIENKSILIRNTEKIIIELLDIDTTYINTNYKEFLNDSRPIIKKFANFIQEYNNMKDTYDNERINSTIPNLRNYVDKELNIIKLENNKILEQSNLFNIHRIIITQIHEGNKKINTYMCKFLDNPDNIKIKFSFLIPLQENINNLKTICFTNNIISNFEFTSNIELYNKLASEFHSTYEIDLRYSNGIFKAKQLYADVIEYQNYSKDKCLNFLLYKLQYLRTNKNPIINKYIFYDTYIKEWNENN